jgi:hypothetical protein
MPNVRKAIFTRILIGGWQLSGQTNKAAIKMEAQKIDVTAFEATAQEFITSDPEPSIDIAGYLVLTATGAGSYEKISMDALTTPTTIGIIRSESATMTGATGFVLPNASCISPSSDYPVEGVMTVAGTWGGATALKRGKSAYSGAVSATGTKASIDLGAQGTLGGDAYLFVTAVTGTATGATIKVQSSATEGGSYADEGTFTFTGQSVTAIALTGTVDRWVRINTTSMGGATAFNVNAIVCVNGVTQ